jgi:hypothetical protein
MTIKEALRLYREGKAILTAIENKGAIVLYVISEFSLVPTGQTLPADK